MNWSARTSKAVVIQNEHGDTGDTGDNRVMGAPTETAPSSYSVFKEEEGGGELRKTMLKKRSRKNGEIKAKIKQGRKR
jgi:hypothetical protein